MSQSATGDADSGLRSYRAQNTLLIATGALAVHFLPFWINWLRTTAPHVRAKTLVTRGATRFVQTRSLEAVSSEPVLHDDWDHPTSTGAPHVELAEWAEAMVVYPASVHYLGRAALGIADSLSLLALRCFDGPIGFAPALPPGVGNSPQTHQHMAALREDPRVTLAPSVPGLSVTTGKQGTGSCVDLPTMLAMVEKKRTELAARAGAGNGDGDADAD